MSEVRFPEMSSDVDATGVIVTWFATTGEQVQADDLIAEVAMDKVDMELHAEASGVLTVLVPEETEVAQGAVIGTID
ncbi:lipoyl domain-containing protein [Microbacterium sp.]|uniref:lipoyl domain-containing protein n=1 Tax=Microbacterium sp. TaxID=51671 RepID=UPI0028119358|nr:biotin/lipoyl-containing protein [Microbacterium sp.]